MKIKDAGKVDDVQVGGIMKFLVSLAQQTNKGDAEAKQLLEDIRDACRSGDNSRMLNIAAGISDYEMKHTGGEIDMLFIKGSELSPDFKNVVNAANIQIPDKGEVSLDHPCDMSDPLDRSFVKMNYEKIRPHYWHSYVNPPPGISTGRSGPAAS